MSRRKPRLPRTNIRQSGRVLGCFDAELSIRRDLFEDSVVICDVETGPVIDWLTHPIFNLSSVIDWLTPFADQRSYTYYIHHHDNIVVELALFDVYDQPAFYRHLHLFHTHPADEGGGNLLGVVDLDQAWILILDNDNQGRFRAEFLGTTVRCHNLRSHLSNHPVP